MTGVRTGHCPIGSYVIMLYILLDAICQSCMELKSYFLQLADLVKLKLKLLGRHTFGELA